MGDNVPAEWAELMVSKGFTDGRYRTGDVPSIEKLAAEARKKAGGGKSPATYTVSNLIFGRQRTSLDVIDAVRLALGLSQRQMQELLARRVGEEFTPHDSARLMTATQRRLVNQVIAEFTKGAEEVSVDEVEQEPTMTRADVTLAAKEREERRAPRKAAGKPRKRGPKP